MTEPVPSNQFPVGSPCKWSQTGTCDSHACAENGFCIHAPKRERQRPSKDVSKQDCTCTDTCLRKGNPFPREWSWRCKFLPYLQPHPGAAHEPLPDYRAAMKAAECDEGIDCDTFIRVLQKKVADQQRELARLQRPAQPPSLELAYRKGWIAAAKWAKRPDLVSDIDSPAYQVDMQAALKEVKP